MISRPHEYELTVLESRLDSFGHVNHAEYVKIFEEARWDLTTRGGYGLEDVLASGIAPIVVHLEVSFRKELKLREAVKVRTVCTAIRKRMIHLKQELFNAEGKLAAEGEVTLVLFDLTHRRMLAPTDRFLEAIGVNKV